MADISTLFTAIGIVIGIINSVIGGIQIYLFFFGRDDKSNTED